MAMVAWPRSSCTSFGCTPRPRSRVAQVCRRSWKRISGRPALLRRGLKDRLTRIRIQKQSVRKKKGWTQLQVQTEEQRAEEIANRRLQTIASLPHLGVFSDEAHHTYGQDVEKSLKRVRQTVDYLAANTRLVCVVNTTGTPYYKKQVLKDVVIWYGLAEGIADGILKEVEDSILSYRFDAAAT